jgi:hypothetical protein
MFRDVYPHPRGRVPELPAALGMLDSSEQGHAHLPEQVHAGDIAAACRARLGQAIP